MKNLSFAVRMLRKSPGFTAVAVLSLALGIGANTAVYSFLDRLLVRSLPVRQPNELVIVTTEGNRGVPPTFSYPFYTDLRTGNRVFTDLLACTALPVVNGVGAFEVAPFLAVSAMLVAVTLLACWLPARRAARIDPMTTLRYE